MGEISVHAQELTVLSKSLRPLPIVKYKDGVAYDGFNDPELRYRQRYIDLIVNDGVKDIFMKRAKVIKTMRAVLDEAGYTEVETPILQSIAGGASARPFITHHNSLDIDLYLRIATELYLKRLIVGGFEGVYEIGKNFRNEGMDRTHNPEFTCMELYVQYKDYNWMMSFTEQLLEKICMAVNGTCETVVDGKTISFKAPLDTKGSSVGVTTVYVPFTRYNDQGEPLYGSEGESHYQLPVIVSGSTSNPDNLTVNIAHSDTLPILNMERFSTREALWYVDMWDYADVPTTINISEGQDVALLNIRLHLSGIDLSDRYLLPITVADGAGYKRNPRKNYATAMLRILPYTDYSGVYQAGNLRFYIVSGGITDPEPGAMETVQTYTVDQNTVFFYAGSFNESSLLRKTLKSMPVSSRLLPMA